MISMKIPDRPWQDVATDLVDYYSNYFELRQFSCTKAQVIIKNNKEIDK